MSPQFTHSPYLVKYRTASAPSTFSWNSQSRVIFLGLGRTWPRQLPEGTIRLPYGISWRALLELRSGAANACGWA
ncbi:hypothetical protein CSUI_008027 [Cystoisospora suis]|uniref:Uncharacterized protein n=1 Tax=Cystoisospora suis TaxID=483139 RepID=A0A2C6JR91_9APIC|nr:hypothetical protein CSUI_008027 [Cystoisospora suis]